jgi:hypothetical protein
LDNFFPKNAKLVEFALEKINYPHFLVKTEFVQENH